MWAVSVLFCCGIGIVWGFCPYRSLKSSFSVSDVRTPLEGQIPMASDSSDPYVRANDFFHSTYQQTQLKILPTTKILHEGDYVVLLLPNGSRIVEPIVEDTYHNLKMISHLPVSAYSTLLANTSKSIELTHETLATLEEFKSLLKNISITSSRFPSFDQLQRQFRIYNATLYFVDLILQKKTCSLDELSQFAWSTSSDINSNLDDSASNSISLLHTHVMNWKKNILSHEQWNELYVATLGSHMSSQESLHRQYFQRVFNLSSSSPPPCGEYQGWSVYDVKSFQLDSSGLQYEDEVMDLVGTHFTDYPMGLHFFHSLYRMHKDALADGAEKALNEIFGPLPSSQDTKKNGNDSKKKEERNMIYLGVMVGTVCISVIAVVFAIIWMKRAMIESGSNDQKLLDRTKASLSSDRPPHDMREL